MHETAIAQNIILILRRICEENKLKNLEKVHLRIGEWNFIQENTLRFAFALLCREEGWGDVKLNIIWEKESGNLYIESVEGEI